MMRRNLIAVLAALAFGALADGPSTRQAATTAPATQPTGALKVRYLDSPLARPLSDVLAERVVKVAEAHRAAGETVWFVLVRSNYYPILAPTSHQFRVSIFYRPTRLGPRVRRGHAAEIDVYAPDGVVHDCVDVSSPDTPFARELPTEPPAEEWTPFSASATRDGKEVPLTDDELAELADFARPILAKAGRAMRALGHVRLTDEKVRVMSGLGASGAIIEGRRTAAGTIERTDGAKMTVYRE